MDELLVLHAFTSDVSASLSVAGVVDKAVRQTADVLEPDVVFLYLREDTALQLRGHWNRLNGEGSIAPPVEKVGVCLCGLAASGGRPLYSRDLGSDPLCTLKECKEAGIRSFAALPLVHQDRVLGVLSIASFEERDFGAQGTFLGILTSHVSIALQNAYLHEQMQQHAEAIRRELREREKAEAQLRESEERFRRIAESMRDLVCEADEKGYYRFVSPSYERILGYRPEELIGESVFARIHPDDVDRIVAEFRQGVSTGQPREAEFRYRSADGTYRWLHASGIFVVDSAGTAGRAVISSRDVTERRGAEEALRESEARFRTLADASFEGVALTRDGTVVDLNDQLAAMLGCRRGELVGKSVIDFVAPQSREKVERAIRLNSVEPYEHFAIRKDGTVFPVEVRARAMEIGGRTLRVTVIRDITQLKRSDEEKRRLHERMLHVQKLESLGVLAGGIAHDFNNLLMAILGNAELSRLRLPPGSPAWHNIEEIEKSSIRASDLCRQMLAYSGKGRFVVERLDVSQVVREMTHMLEVSISKKAVLRCDFAQHLPPVEADAAQIRQVIVNLVMNASDAIGDRSGVISLTTGAMECDRRYLGETYIDENLPEGLYAYVEVSDTGSGMNESTRERIFDPFFSTKFTGRGLGLAAVLGIVRGHRGAVRLHSEPGKGTTFKILFPTVAGGVIAEAGVPDARKTMLFGGCILLIDDEETIRAVSRDMLETLGFQVLTAADGREAVEVFRSHAKEISCVILDLTMPHMSGEEAFRELRHIRRDIPVILSSGYNEQDVTQRFVGKGLAGFIQKPYTLKSLSDTLKTVLDRAGGRNERERT